MINLTTENFKVEINEKGAELQSICFNDVEYLWQADAKFWGKHSPVLFPIVGELKAGKYYYNNKEYKLPRHGFARDKIFKAEKTSETSAVFTLRNDEETFKVYPFEFIFCIEYAIQKNEIFCTFSVQNINAGIMYFSVGAHPAFKVPLSDNIGYSDYALTFNNDNFLERYLLQDGLISGETETIKLTNKTLPLQPSLFYKDAIVLKHIKSTTIELNTSEDAHKLRFKFDGFPYFGIWAAKDAPFICLEPWCGIADNIHHNNKLANKEGINMLEAGKKWQRIWSIAFFD